LSVFEGTDPNGVWSLYVMDDLAGDAGRIDGGWVLSLTTADGVDPGLLLSRVQWQGGQCRFLLSGRATETYVVEGSSDLVNWTPIATPTLAADTQEFTVAAGGAWRFFRAWRQP
jgi:hypothetical protein